MTEWYEGIVKSNTIKAQQLKESSNLGARFSNRTFANFDRRRDERAFSACVGYANKDNLFRMESRADKEFTLEAKKLKDEDRYRNGLILMGSSGNGKTHLAASIANCLADRGIMCQFGTFSDFLEELRQEFSSDTRTMLAKLKTVPMLVIDDLGQEKRTEWTQQVLYDIVNYRYEHLLPLVITTNFNVDSLANHVGGAVMSRFLEMCSLVETQGNDYRDARNH